MASFATDDRGALFIMAGHHAPTPAEHEVSLRVFEARLARGDRFAFIFDGSQVSGLDPALRRIQGEWIRLHEDAIRARCLGVGFVFPSAMYHFVLSSIFLVKPLPVPYDISSTLEGAVTWATKLLGQHGLTVGAPNGPASAASPARPPTSRRSPSRR